MILRKVAIVADGDVRHMGTGEEELSFSESVLNHRGRVELI